MPSLRHTSKPAKAPFVLLAMLVTLLAVIAVRPAAGLAAPLEPSEPEPPQLSFDPDSYDFGLQSVNSGASTGIQLRNTGSEAVQVNSVEITGPGSGVFGTNTGCPGMMLQPGNSCFIQVYFNPHEAVEYSAQLRASAGSHSFSADLSGTGGRAILEPDSNPTDFGVAKVGSSGTTREIEIVNVGNMDGGVFIAVISGGAVGSYQLLDEDCTGYRIAPAATCTVQVRFRPLSEGVKKATLSLFGESDGGTQIVLTGVGTASDQPDSAPSGAASSGGTGPAAGATAAPSSVTVEPGLSSARKGKPKVNRRHRRHLRADIHKARLALRR
ncbi:MAG TPA: choice-of-anchor D domain-containing protein [Solirubrobacterales bacterium]